MLTVSNLRIDSFRLYSLLGFASTFVYGRSSMTTVPSPIYCEPFYFGLRRRRPSVSAHRPKPSADKWQVTISIAGHKVRLVHWAMFGNYGTVQPSALDLHDAPASHQLTPSSLACHIDAPLLSVFAHRSLMCQSVAF